MNKYHRLSPFALCFNLLLLGCLLITLLIGFALCLVSVNRPKGDLNQSRHTQQIQSVQHWEKI